MSITTKYTRSNGDTPFITFDSLCKGEHFVIMNWLDCGYVEGLYLKMKNGPENCIYFNPDGPNEIFTMSPNQRVIRVKEIIYKV